MAVPEIPLYLDRAHQDLQAAQTNLQHGFYGVSVTRAYYAMFYGASALLASKGISRSKHRGVLSAFGEQFVKAGLIGTEYAKTLGHAFDSRLDSDYDIAFTAERALRKRCCATHSASLVDVKSISVRQVCHESEAGRTSRPPDRQGTSGCDRIRGEDLPTV